MIFQVGAALLDACVLSALRREDTYGYVLTQTLMGTLEISESTLYPVLRRLQKDELLSIYDRPHMGRNRRYYSITDKGLRQADVYRTDWREYKSRVDSLILADGGKGADIASGGPGAGSGGPGGGVYDDSDGAGAKLDGSDRAGGGLNLAANGARGDSDDSGAMDIVAGGGARGSEEGGLS
jgi:PadR family transcriptional regulator PadR